MRKASSAVLENSVPTYDNPPAIPEPMAVEPSIAEAFASAGLADRQAYRALARAVANGEKPNARDAAALLQRLNCSPETLDKDVLLVRREKEMSDHLGNPDVRHGELQDDLAAAKKAFEDATEALKPLRATYVNLKYQRTIYSMATAELGTFRNTHKHLFGKE